MKIAIIGSGISGLSSALLLSQKHNITLFESNNRFGGHANTVEIMHKENVIPVDTGFIVYNKLNYPNLVSFFDFLKVETIDSDMSFAVSARDGQLEYSGSMKGIFAQKKNFFNLKFYRMLKDIIIFFIFGSGFFAKLVPEKVAQRIPDGRPGGPRGAPEGPETTKYTKTIGLLLFFILGILILTTVAYFRDPEMYKLTTLQAFCLIFIGPLK